ncbi:MAG: alpha/beta hydrolase [Myxococcota bacterium]
MSSLIRWLTAPAIEIGAMASDTLAVLRQEERYRDVPAVEPSAGVITEAIVDGTFSLMVGLLVGVPDAQRVRHGHQELLAMREFIGRNGWFDDPAGYHRTPPPLRNPLISKKEAFSFGRRGSSYKELVFESEYEPHPGEPGRERWLSHSDNGTAVAHVMEHEDGDRPWIIATHGFSMGQAASNMKGLTADWLHHELGLNVLMPVLPLHGARSSTRMSGGGLLQPEYTNMLHMFSQAIWDIRRMITWVRDRTERPVGLYGISLGGYTVSLVSAFVDDLACVIAGIPAVDFTSLARDNEPWAYQAYGNDLKTDWGLVTEVIHPVSPLTFEPRLPVDRRFIYAGVADRVARPDQARALWRHWDKPEIEWLPTGHVMATMSNDVQPFMRKVLGETLFPNGEAPSEDKPRTASSRRPARAS